MTPIRKIFISYRQADNRGFVVRIRDWLAHKYGRDNVFMDFDTLPPFVKFEDFIKQRIAESDVILAVIGENWLQAFAEKAAEGEKDYVLIELETALKAGKLIAPVLILDAQMPRRKDVPEGLRDLCDYNAANLRDDRSFYDEFDRMIAALEFVPGQISSPPPAAAEAKMTASDYYLRAVQRASKNDPEGAISDYGEAIRLKSGYRDAYKNRADLYEKKKDYDAAIQDYTTALYYAPDDYLVVYRRGKCLEEKQDFQGALADYTETIRLNPTWELGYIVRAEIYLRQFKYTQAMDDYAQAIKLPHPASAYDRRGDARFKHGDLRGAIADWREAVKQDSSYERRVSYKIDEAKEKLKKRGLRLF